ncbi:MAG: hypothetical protein ACFFCS_10525 [Candidatus Hodarchaeota archaeon]
MSNWRGSPYPFKSPHRKWGMKRFYNGICELLNENEDSIGYYWRDNEGKGAAFSARVVSMLDAFMKFGSYSSVEAMERILPLKYVFLLPVRHGIVVFSAYSLALSKVPGRPAAFETLDEYMGFPVGECSWEAGYPEFIFHRLLADCFRLYSLVKPFRLLMGLPVRKRWYGYKKMQPVLKENAESVAVKIGQMKEWHHVSDPSSIIIVTGEILQKKGFNAALKHVRNVFRASEKVRNILSGIRGTPLDPEKVKSLTTRYLSVEGISLPQYVYEVPPKNLSQKGKRVLSKIAELFEGAEMVKIPKIAKLLPLDKNEFKEVIEEWVTKYDFRLDKKNLIVSYGKVEAFLKDMKEYLISIGFT